jgi:hypothetical protein
MALPGYFQWDDMVQRQFKNLEKIQFIYFKNANNITDKTNEVLWHTVAVQTEQKFMKW